MRQVMGALTVLIGCTAGAAAAGNGGTAETASLLLIGGSLIFGAAISRSRSRRG